MTKSHPLNSTPVTHPMWCDLHTCGTDEHGFTHHVSVPFRWKAQTAHADLLVARGDEAAFPDERTTPYVEMTAKTDDFETTGEEVWFSPWEARELAHALITAAAVADGLVR